MKLFFAVVLWTVCTEKFGLNMAAFAVLKWNKKLGIFDRIVGLPSGEIDREKIFLQGQLEEKHNFNGRALYITYHQSTGFFRFYANDTKATGICGDIWTILSGHLNFTIVLTRRKENSLGLAFQNGSFGGLLEYARLNQTDVIPKMEVYISRFQAVKFTPVFWMNSQRIFASGQWKRNRAWMFNLFPFEVWSLIFIFIATLSLASMLTQRVLIRHRHRKIRARSCFDHLFYTFATLCNQGHVPDNTGSGSRILTLTIGIFSWLTLIGYSSRLIYSMAQEVFDAPFNDLETLFAHTNFRIVVMDGTVSHMCFASPNAPSICTRLLNANRVVVVTNISDLYNTVCLNPDEYVLFHGTDEVGGRHKMFCRLIPVGMSYYVTPIASGISRRVKNRRSIDIGIMKLREFGLIDGIKKRYISSNVDDPVVRHTDSLAIDMDRVFLIFAMLLIGVAASIVICVLENMVFALRKRKNMHFLGQRFPTIQQRLFGTPVRTQVRQ